MLLQARADEAARTTSSITTGGTTSIGAGGVAGAGAGAENDEGYWAYMSRQLNERAERLGIVSEGVDRLESNSAGWVDDVSKFVGKQKRGLMLGALRKGVGL